MARGPRTKYEHPELPNALAWLRARLNMTQSGVAEAAGITPVYYSQLERGVVTKDGAAKFPSVQTLDSVLGALNSDWDELDGLLVHKPWSETPETAARASRMRSSTPKPALYDPVRLASSAVEQQLQRTPPPESASYSAASAIRGQFAELQEIYQNLSHQDRDTLLGFARARDPRRKPHG